MPEDVSCIRGNVRKDLRSWECTTVALRDSDQFSFFLSNSNKAFGNFNIENTKHCITLSISLCGGLVSEKV